MKTLASSQKTIQAALFVCSMVLSIQISNAQNVGIGTATPHPSAILDLSSDSLGLLIPSMSIAQRDDISSPATGLMVFITDDNAFYCYEGSSWEKVGSGALQALLEDLDGDTKIQVEELADDDIIRFDMGGTEFFRMDSGRLEVLGTGQSVFIGENAGESDNLSDNHNVFVGYDSGRESVTGKFNTAVGHESLRSNISGRENTAIGHLAMSHNTDGDYNVGVGGGALNSNTSGSRNIAVGHESLAFNTTGNSNSAIGLSAMLLNTSGSSNTAIGDNAHYKNVTGSQNVALGNFALWSSDGDKNVAVGTNAQGLATGNKNVAIGYSAGNNVEGDSSVFIGFKSGFNEEAGHRLYIENSDADSANALIYGEFDNNWLRINGHLTATDGLSDSDNDTKIRMEGAPDDDIIRFDMGGTEYFRMDSGRLEVLETGQSVFVGQHAGESDDLTDNRNVFVGHESGHSNVDGYQNTAVGTESFKSNVSGYYNTATGYAALRDNTDGVRNTGFGVAALSTNSSGSLNTAVGAAALVFNSTGQSNTAIGANTLIFNEVGDQNVAIGANAQYSNISGTHNTALGNSALYQNNGDKNVAVGALSQNVATGNKNAALGYMSGFQVSGDSSVFIGYKSGYNETDGQRLYIENSDAGSDSALIYGEFDNDLLRVNGHLSVRDGLADDDSDTRIRMDESPDDDIIRFDMGGTEYFRMDSGRLEVMGTGHSVFLGEHAGESDDLSFNGNSFLGYSSGKHTSSGFDNTAIGISAASGNISGFNNVAIGAYSLQNAETSYNSAVGAYALNSATGEKNSAFGYSALALAQGSKNVAVGEASLQALSDVNAWDNVAIGAGTLYHMTSGTRNTVVGRAAGNYTLGSGNVFMGYRAGFNEIGSDRLYIENSDADSTDALIYGEFDNNLLRLNGDVGVGATPTHKLDVDGQIRMRTGAADGYVPVSDIDGVMSWSDPTDLGLWQKSATDIHYNTGQVGIGVTNPTAVLHIKNLDTAATILRVISSNGLNRLKVEDNGVITMRERMIIEAHTRDAITLQGQNSHSFLGVGFKKSGGNYAWNMYHAVNNNNLIFAAGNDADITNLDAKVTFEGATGDVGIGVAPTEKLDVDGQIRMRSGAVTGYVPVSNSSGVMTWTAPSNLGMWEKTGSELHYSGNVGVGTDNPESQFHVVGETLVRDSSRTALTLQLDNNSDEIGLAFRRSGSNYEWNMYRETATADLVFTHGDNADISALPEVLRLDNNQLKLNDGDIVMDRGSTTNTLTRALTITGARNANSSSFAEINFKNIDNNNSITEYTGARIASYNQDSNDDGDLRFYTTNTVAGPDEAMRIDKSGNIGIGTTSPDNKLHVEVSSDVGNIARFNNINTGTNSDGVVIKIGPDTNPTSTNRFLKFNDQDGTTVGFVSGDGAGGVTYGSPSDIRLKTEIRDFTSGLETLAKIRPAIYEMKSKPGEEQIGFIAQEMLEVLPHIVGGSPDDSVDMPLAIDYGKVTPVLAAAIQEQQEVIEALQASNAELASRETDLENRIVKLEHLVLQLSQNIEQVTAKN